MKEKQYDVALSFAGEDRYYAEQLANLLKAGGHSVFYDQFERAQLWGKDLYVHLSSVYKDQARYCVMFLSKHYAAKLWTKHELQSAQARAFVEENREYILPIRFDDTEIPGILLTAGYLDLRSMTIEEIYQVLVEKLSGATSQTTARPQPKSREDFIKLAQEHANIGGWYDESILEQIGRDIYSSWQGEEILENYEQAWKTLANV